MRGFLLDLALALAIGAATYSAVVYLLQDVDPPRLEAK